MDPKEAIQHEHDAAVRAIQKYGSQMIDRIQFVMDSAENGHPLNSLGELQAIASNFEANVGAYARLHTILGLMEGK